MHKLQYDIESLKQERDATALRHQEQLRFAENKADADFTKLQVGTEPLALCPYRIH